MNTGAQFVALLSALGAAVAVHVIARPRPGRLLLVRVADAAHHRVRARRVLAVNALLAVVAAAVILAAPDPTGRTQGAAWIAAVFVPPLWCLAELRLALRHAGPPPMSARYHVWLERPPGLLSYLSAPLQLLNVASMIAPPLLLLAVWQNSSATWLSLFLPLMLFLTALVLFSAWMQARERWALPADDQQRYVTLQLEQRRRRVRVLETGLLCWNIAIGLIWISAAAGHAGPGYIGVGAAVVIGGVGVAAALALQLPVLTRLADELATIAGAEALGTRREGWRAHGLLYFSTSDPALFVPKRGGLGQTINFGRPAAWIFVAGVLLVPPAIILLALAGARP